MAGLTVFFDRRLGFEHLIEKKQRWVIGVLQDIKTEIAGFMACSFVVFDGRLDEILDTTRFDCDVDTIDYHIRLLEKNETGWARIVTLRYRIIIIPGS